MQFKSGHQVRAAGSAAIENTETERENEGERQRRSIGGIARLIPAVSEWVGVFLYHANL